MFEQKRLQSLICDKDRLDAFIRENYADIYRYCFYHVGEKDLAQDITQEAFLKFLKGLEHYEEYGKLKNYLYVIARNCIRDSFRKPRETALEDAAEPFSDGGLEGLPARVDLSRALQSLEPLERELLLLRYEQELKLRDIARILQLPVSTARYKLKHAEKTLKARLGATTYD
ncbi:MAG: RNA polymerase sigma factor [Eubacteriales bacterium]|nr:RNA polymerase sigma factor [Eubacteriales bacterium]